MLHISPTSTPRAFLNSVRSMRILSHCDSAHPELAWSSLRSLDIVACKQMFVGFTWPEDVSCFAVNHVIACEELFFGHAEGNSADVFNEAHDERGPDDVPADDKEGSYNSTRYKLACFPNFDKDHGGAGMVGKLGVKTYCSHTCFPFPSMAPPKFTYPKAAHPSIVANKPAQKPPTNPATQ